MITDSPHIYRRLGAHAGRLESVIDNSLEQANAVENRGLAPVLTLNHLAHNSGVSYEFLRGIVTRDSDPYLSFEVSRKSSTRARTISSPKPALMHVQRWILKKILNRIPAHSSSFAYESGKSIVGCARKHLGASWIVKLDIHDFFESIDETRIYRVFTSAGYQPLPSLELARICTRYAGHSAHIDRSKFSSPHGSYGVISSYSVPYLGYLPQGSPTSGALANHVALALDRRLFDVASELGLVYTRYADDMTFSSSGAFQRTSAEDLIGRVSREIRRCGFAPHQKKTKIIPPGARKIVLGLLVDGTEVRLSREFRIRIMNHIRGAEKFGLSGHRAHRGFTSIRGMVNHIHGLISYSRDVSPEWAADVAERWTLVLERDGWT
ncbi:reverse transcriptase family protein [Kitasatospora aureofaciens]|uniref:reverse transcriptase family protein n=1 Tax=Kitasatospora aureofaciens TaxID=1894 RepID=UPI0033E1E68E